MRRDVLEAMADELLRGRREYFGDGFGCGSDPAEAREKAKEQRAFDDLLIRKIRRAGRSLRLTPDARYALTVASAPMDWCVPVERGPTPISDDWRRSL